MSRKEPGGQRWKTILHSLAPVPGKKAEEDQVLSKGMKLKQPLETNSMTSPKERDSRCGWFSGSGKRGLSLAFFCVSLEPKRICCDSKLQPWLGLPDCGFTMAASPLPVAAVASFCSPWGGCPPGRLPSLEVHATGVCICQGLPVFLAEERVVTPTLRMHNLTPRPASHS